MGKGHRQEALILFSSPPEPRWGSGSPNRCRSVGFCLLSVRLGFWRPAKQQQKEICPSGLRSMIRTCNYHMSFDAQVRILQSSAFCTRFPKKAHHVLKSPRIAARLSHALLATSPDRPTRCGQHRLVFVKSLARLSTLLSLSHELLENPHLLDGLRIDLPSRYSVVSPSLRDRRERIQTNKLSQRDVSTAARRRGGRRTSQSSSGPAKTSQ